MGDELVQQAEPTSALVQVPNGSFPIQRTVHTSGEATADGLNAWAPATYMGDLEFQSPSFILALAIAIISGMKQWVEDFCFPFSFAAILPFK